MGNHIYRASPYVSDRVEYLQKLHRIVTYDSNTKEFYYHEKVLKNGEWSKEKIKCNFLNSAYRIYREGWFESFKLGYHPIPLIPNSVEYCQDVLLLYIQVV